MSFTYQQDTGLITLSTKNTTYQMQADRFGYLLHLYYGRKMTGDARQILTYGDRGFSGNPQDAGLERTYSLDELPQEFPFQGSADFRTPAFCMQEANGAYGCDLRFDSVTSSKGKYGLKGLPTSYAEDEDQAETVCITLKDKKGLVQVELLYGIFEESDVITRAVRVTNTGDEAVSLQKIASASMDFPFGDYEMLSFYGRHAMERNLETTRIGHGRFEVGSRRGNSSHQYNPFVILKDAAATEDHGDVYGIHFVYSGNFLSSAEKDQYGNVRWIMGLNESQFSWRLEPGQSFDAPETLMAYSAEGLTGLTHIYHDFIREHIVRGPWKEVRRPILINNWEATYFDFDGDKLFAIAKQAAELGVEMLVLDDGWFGKRESDLSGLGDWQVNTKKLHGTMGEVAERIKGLGMKFGLWFEPEAISEDSDLYRAHPDWALTLPGRDFSRSRHQLVLDFSRQEVVDHIFGQMCEVLDHADISYIKWDMNRHLTDVYSAQLSADRQGEVFHRFTLGVYDLLTRLQERYPQILFEGCSGGGGRFDTGMLCYTPQIWCSDNTDAADRCIIQYGTSFGYPVSTMGAHVSKAPNDQTGKFTPFATRGIVASAGSFGYELDLNKVSDEEKEMVRTQIQTFKEDFETVHHGDYYRLTNPTDAGEIAAWICVSKDGRSAVLSAVQMEAHGNPQYHFLKLRGLDAERIYTIRETGETFTGASLMYAGYVLPVGTQYDAWRFHLECQD